MGFSPIVQVMKPGKYAWCSCGESKKQPFCDGSHGPTGKTPLFVEIEKEQKVAWCTCKLSSKKPYCDGTHSKVS